METEHTNQSAGQRAASGRYAAEREATNQRERDENAAELARERTAAASAKPSKFAGDADEKPHDWELPEGTVKSTLPDGSTLYTLPDGSQRHVHVGQPNHYIFKADVDGVDKPTVKEIADHIRDHVDLNYSQKVHPDEQHLHATAVAVTEELGMEPNALNVNHVSGLINAHVVAPSREYPKMKYNHRDKREIVVDNAKEEEALGEGWVDTHWSAPLPKGDVI
jgi:hypothetical protein